MNEIGADKVKKEKKIEQESINANVKADIALVLPMLPENVDSDNIQIMLDYKTITQAVDDYIERYTIDPRISEIDYQLSTPKMPDKDATNNLKECLTGETDEVSTSNETTHVDNSAITDEKVTLTFELSVEENVYLDDISESSKSHQDKHQSENTSQPNKNSAHSTMVSESVDNQTKSEIIIQSSNSNLYWQNAPSTHLYWQNAPSDISQPSNLFKNNRTLVTDDEVLDDFRKIGSGLENGMSSTETIERLGYVMVGDNGRVYTNPHACGNQYYRIVGRFSENGYVRRLGLFGRAVSYGTTFVQTGIKYAQAETSQERGRVIGASLGQVSIGAGAYAIASTVTTTILVSIAVATGVSTAPVTIVIIAGASIIAGIAASTAIEQVGQEIGGNIGEGTVDCWQFGVNKTREELRRYKEKRIEDSCEFRHSIKREK